MARTYDIEWTVEAKKWTNWDDSPQYDRRRHSL